MKKTPKIAVVLVNWNGADETLPCLDSLCADHYPNKQVIVVDNGSTDDSVARIREKHPEATLVELETNRGFTGGNNAGIEEALACDADYICLLNNDTTVEPDTMAALVNVSESDPAAGVVMPAIYHYNEPREPWFIGSKLDLIHGAAWHDNARSLQKSDPPFEIPWASGCALCTRADVMRRLRGLDDRYFIYWEDIDFSVRVRRLGLKLLLVPNARIYHKVSRSAVSSSRASRYYHVRNSLLFVSTHSGRGYIRAFYEIMRLRLRECAKAMIRRQVAPYNEVGVTLHGLFDHLRGRYGRYTAARQLVNS